MPAYTLAEGLLARVGGLLGPLRGIKGFGNGRQVRTLFEATILKQSTRITELPDPSSEQVRSLTLADLPSKVSGGEGDDATPYL
jgi:hypothetical protein